MLPETVGGVLSVDVADEFSNDFCVGLRLEHEPFGSQKLLDILVVGDDAIVNNFIKFFLILYIMKYIT